MSPMESAALGMAGADGKEGAGNDGAGIGGAAGRGGGGGGAAGRGGGGGGAARGGGGGGGAARGGGGGGGAAAPKLFGRIMTVRSPSSSSIARCSAILYSPTSTLLFSSMRVGPLMVAPLTWVPLALPSSTTTGMPFTRSSRACLREAVLEGSAMLRLWSRPMVSDP